MSDYEFMNCIKICCTFVIMLMHPRLFIILHVLIESFKFNDCHTTVVLHSLKRSQPIGLITLGHPDPMKTLM